MSSSNLSTSTLAKRKRRSEENAFLGKVIDSVKAKNCLFDRYDKHFNDEDAVEAAWKDVANSCSDNGTQQEDEMVEKVQKAWESCKKSFSKERSRRSQQPSSNGGWSLYEQMSFMDEHIKRKPRSGNSIKRSKVDDDSQKENQDLNHSTSGLPVGQRENDQLQDSDPAVDEMQQQQALELARREKQIQDMEAGAAKERALQLKLERLQADREEARNAEEQRRQECEARRQELAKQSKKEESEKKLIKSTADYVVGVLDSIENEDVRMELAHKIMDILYTP